MRADRCTFVNGVPVRPRVSYHALVQDEEGIGPVRRPVQYVLPLLLTETGFHDVPIALLYACLRTK